MKSDRQWIASRVVAAAVPALLFFASPRAHAATTEYQYDALARLRRVVHDNGVVTRYALDAAGNRTQVDDQAPVLPSAPPSLTVPVADVVGSYLLSWGASTGQVLRYELDESAGAAFAVVTPAYSGEATSVQLRGRASGTYYYRVRACGVAGCGGYTAGSNAIAVTAPVPTPAAPTNLVARFVGTCVWRATWDVVPGAASYRLRESGGSVRTVDGTSADVVCPGGQNTNRPESVRACNSAGACSAAASF